MLNIINIPEKPELLNLAKDIKFVGMAQENALYYTFGYKKCRKLEAPRLLDIPTMLSGKPENQAPEFSQKHHIF